MPEQANVVDNLMRRVDELSARLRRLEDEREIRAKIESYGHSIDYGLEQNWVDIFTPDGVLDIRLRQIPQGISEIYPYVEVDDGGFKVVGAEALTKFATDHTRAPHAYHKHVVTNFQVVFDGPDKARASTYAFRIDEIGDRREFIAFGRHLDEVVRCADGCWRVKYRRYELESNGAANGPDLQRYVTSQGAA